MGLLPEQFVHQVQQATDIVDLVGQYVSIRQRGRDYVGLCPFHQEKTPSFYVSPTKQIFKCFGCQAGGGVFQFVQKQQNVSFPDAVRFLAERAGIPVPRGEGQAVEAGMDRGELVRLMRFAADFYRSQLRGDAGRDALAYARGRKFSEESIDRFELGYAPDRWDSLYSAAREAGFRDRQLLAVGLVVERREGNGCYDRFRNRLMFPIIDQAGRVLAFGGRALSAEERAKYLNSPETVLFDKSSCLFGLNWAHKAISAEGSAVVVEGYFDALMPIQEGVENVVATLGTSLTDRHVRMLSRLATDVTLLFDADAAGARAAERGLELFIAQQMNVRVAAVPDGKDPCDYVLSAGAEALRTLVADAPDALEHVWREQMARLGNTGNLVDRRKAAEAFLRVVVTSAAYEAIDPMRQGMLINRLAHLMGVSVEQMTARVRQMVRKVPTSAQRRPSVASGREDAAPALGPIGAKRRILEVLIAEPDLFEHAARHVGVEDFADDPLLHAVAREVWRLGSEGDLSCEELLNIDAGPQWGSLITDLLNAGESRGNYAATLAGDLELVEYHLKGPGTVRRAELSDDEALRQVARSHRPSPRRRPW